LRIARAIATFWRCAGDNRVPPAPTECSRPILMIRSLRPISSTIWAPTLCSVAWLFGSLITIFPKRILSYRVAAGLYRLSSKKEIALRSSFGSAAANCSRACRIRASRSSSTFSKRCRAGTMGRASDNSRARSSCPSPAVSFPSARPKSDLNSGSSSGRTRPNDRDGCRSRRTPRSSLPQPRGRCVTDRASAPLRR
jgi:hypothetical protein